MKIIGIGETVLDVIFRNDQPEAAVPGGSTFNSMISLGRTLRNTGNEIPVMMVTETGDDHIGDIIVSFMEANGVSTEAVTRNRGTQTHVSMAFLNDRNDAEYEFYKDHAHACLKEDTLADIDFKPDDIVLFGSFFAINPKIRKNTQRLLKAAHDAGATLYYDVNFRRNHIADLPETMGNILENCSLSTFVRGSDEDFGFLFGTSDPETVYRDHIAALCPNFICTCGNGPVHVFTPDFHGKYEVEKIETVSTIGAGDNFNAGFIFGLIADKLSLAQDMQKSLTAHSWEKYVRIACQFSSNVCRSMYNYVDNEFKPV